MCQFPKCLEKCRGCQSLCHTKERRLVARGSIGLLKRLGSVAGFIFGPTGLVRRQKRRGHESDSGGDVSGDFDVGVCELSPDHALWVCDDPQWEDEMWLWGGVRVLMDAAPQADFPPLNPGSRGSAVAAS